MRKKMIFAAMAALMVLVSCGKEETIENTGKDPQETPCGEAPVFTAAIAGATKTTISMTDGKVSWEADDEITVKDASGSTAVYKIESIDAENGHATFVIKAGETIGDGPYTATYGTEPAKLQSYSATAGKLYMTAPETSGDSFTFKVQCGLMKLNLTQAEEDVRKITVSGTTAEGEACAYTLTCETAESIAAAKDFFIALPAGGYKKFVFTDSEGKVCVKKAKSSPLEMIGNHILPVTISSMTFAPALGIFDAKPAEEFKAIQW